MALLIAIRMQIQRLRFFVTINQVTYFAKISALVSKLLSFMCYSEVRKCLYWIQAQLKVLWIFHCMKLCNP